MEPHHHIQFSVIPRKPLFVACVCGGEVFISYCCICETFYLVGKRAIIRTEFPDISGYSFIECLNFESVNLKCCFIIRFIFD